MLANATLEKSRLLLVSDFQIYQGDETVEIIKSRIYQYLSKKTASLPEDLFHLQNFDSEDGLFSSEFISSKELTLWAGRISEPDSTVAGRFWTIEFALANDRRSFGIKLRCFSRNFDFEFKPSTPAILKQLTSERFLIADGYRLSLTPTEIESEADVDWLIALIVNPRRTRNVIVYAADVEGYTALNPEFACRTLAGAAHIVKIFPRASHILSEKISKSLSVFDYGVRTYRPTRDLANDDQYAHPLLIRSKLEAANLVNVELTILQDAFRQTLTSSIDQGSSLPSFIRIRSAAASFRLADAQVSGDLSTQIVAAIEAKTAAEAQADEAVNLAAEEERLRKETESLLNSEKSKSVALAARIAALEEKLANANAINGSDTPKDYEDLPSWIEREFAGRLRLHPRAVRSLKDAEYMDFELVVKCLGLLAGPYVDTKRGDRDAWTAFEGPLKESGVELSKSISDSRAGEEGDEYFVKDRRGNRVMLDQHLKRGTSRSPRRDLRIYFYWDEEDQQVVVGGLPSHLTNRLT